MNDIMRAEATYSGGGIYIYTGQLVTGEYFLAADDWEDTVIILDVDPFEHWEENGFEDWQNAHTLFTLSEIDAFMFWKELLKKVDMFDCDRNLRLEQLYTDYPEYA